MLLFIDNDCGVYVCMFCVMFMMNYPLIDFRGDLGQCRRMIALSIILGKLEK